MQAKKIRQELFVSQCFMYSLRKKKSTCTQVYETTTTKKKTRVLAFQSKYFKIDVEIGYLSSFYLSWFCGAV